MKTILFAMALVLSIGNAYAQSYTVVFLSDGTQMICWKIGVFIQCDKQ
jgi:hypothetical protein